MLQLGFEIVRMTKIALWVSCVLCLIGLMPLPYAYAQNAQFDVFEYRVEGATLLPVALIEEAVYPHLGEQKTLDDVERARDALERAYHAAGYLTVLVTIPQQKVEEAVVRLAVTEAPVKRLRVVDSRYFSPADIKDRDTRAGGGERSEFSRNAKTAGEPESLRRSPGHTRASGRENAGYGGSRFESKGSAATAWQHRTE